MPQALPWVGLGLGLYQTISGQQMQQRAIEEARRPRLTPEAQAILRREGTSNIQAKLASRGLLDSSLFTGALAGLERGIGEATATAGTAGDVPGLLAQQALGLGQSGAGLIGNLADIYMLQRLLGPSRDSTTPSSATPAQTFWPQYLANLPNTYVSPGFGW